MEQNPSSERNSLSASPEILSLLWNPKVHYRIQNSLPRVPILSQMHPVHNLTPNSPKIHFNIILLYVPMSSKTFLLTFWHMFM
jgi:hypothetical protein